MLEVKNVSFSYGQNPVLENIGFTVKEGQHISLVGESGCGKSTLLKVIYGLLHPEKGEISWNGKKLLGPHFNIIPGEPFIKYLSQDFDLMPFISVEENVGKFLSNFYPEEKKERTAQLLELVEMTDFAKTKAKFLSGGQQQRVALAKVLAKEPELLLLDEPFSNIDNFRKNRLRRNLFTYFKEKSISCIVATHDNEDSLSYADEAIIIKNGAIITKNHPKHLYENPKNNYVASLFGEVNELPASLFTNSAKNGETVLLYPQELKIVEQSALKVVTGNSFYKGQYFLIEASFSSKTIFFQHSGPLEKGTVVFLDAEEDLIKNRI